MSRTPLTIAFAALVAATSIAATAAEAQSFRAYNRDIVNPVSPGTFEAIEGARCGAQGRWCAAADYALKRLGASGTSRLYVQSPRGASVTAPVSVGATSSASRTPGANLSVDHAYQFCYNARIINSR